jgi:hypothetical protein
VSSFKVVIIDRERKDNEYFHPNIDQTDYFHRSSMILIFIVEQYKEGKYEAG